MKVRGIAFSSGVLALLMLASSTWGGFRTPVKTSPSSLYFDIGSTLIVTIASGGDFDGDGWSDIVVSGNSTLVVLLNDGVW